MNMNYRSLTLSILLGMIVHFAVEAQTLPEKQFFHPDRVKYDKDCFTIEGKDIFILSAAFHYFRCPQELWRDRFRKIKEAGFNTVETYVPWNWHERNMPKSVDDYSQCNFDDLKAWLHMAHEEFGLYTIVRPGPFICAEWAGGAYPRWLAKFCPDSYDTSFWLRSNHPEHMKWSEHWYNAVCRVFSEEQLTRKQPGEKGIIMVQLENEYIYFDMESEKKEEFLRVLSDACIRNGIDVPLFTCVTPEVRGSHDPVISQLFDMDNQYVWWNMHEAKSRIEKLKAEQPNAPAFVCELQGGWFSTVGGRLSEDSYLDGRHARGMALMAMAGGSTGLNYYMFFGGTHFAGWGARRMTTTYDYGAPLKENGGVGEKYAAVKGIGEVVDKFGGLLVRSRSVRFDVQGADNLTIGIRRAADGTLFVFLLNRDKKQAFRQLVNLTVEGKPMRIDCQLAALDSKLLVVHAGTDTVEWYPREQTLPERPVALPLPITITDVWRKDEDFRGDWIPLRKGKSLPELGVNDCRYSMYRSQVNLTQKEVDRYGSLVFELFTGDPVYVRVNGEFAERVSKDELDNTFIVSGLLHKGVNEIIAIYENRGHAHGYRPMEELSGVKQAGFGRRQTGIQPIEEWFVKSVGTDEPRLMPAVFAEDAGWEKILLDQQTIDNLATLQIAGLEKPKWPAAWILQEKAGCAVYRTCIRWTPEMIREGMTVLEFGCIDDAGTLWVNGVEVGTHEEWDKPYVINVAPFIHKGDNEIAMVVSNRSGAGGLLKGVRLKQEFEVIKKLNWEVSTDLGGICQDWNLGTGSTEGWSVVKLSADYPLVRKGELTGTVDGGRDALLTWYRLEFNMPRKNPSAWIPWKLIVNATGTGYMWLNGHNIGRYWEEGPQREFYLPECWLRAGEKNVIILGLRQSETKGACLFGAEVAPYTEDVECMK